MGDLPPEEVGRHHRLKKDLPRDKVLAEESALARSKAHLPLPFRSTSPMLTWIRGERLLGNNENNPTAGELNSTKLGQDMLA